MPLLTGRLGTADSIPGFIVPGVGPGPTVETLPATHAAKGATLRGAVNPNGLATTYFFEYWEGEERPELPSRAPVENVDAGEGTDLLLVFQKVTGLKKGTRYGFRLCATNSEGEGIGAALSFLTDIPLRVVERPPMRQCVIATTPGGRVYRWGEDEPEAANVLEDFSDSDTAPGGNKDFTGTLPRRPEVDYADMKVGTRLEVIGAGGYKVSEYRLERTPRTSGDFLVMDPAASGYQVLLTDNEGVRAIFLDADMTAWGEASAERRKEHPTLGYGNSQVRLLPAGTPSGESGTTPEPSSAISHAWSQMNNNGDTEPDVAESWYDSQGVQLGEILVEFLRVKGLTPGDTNWNDEVYASEDGVNVAEQLNDFNATTAEGKNAFAIAAQRFYLMLRDYYSLAIAQEGNWEAQWRNVKVRDRSGLPLYGAWPNIGILASDVIAYLLSQFAPGIRYTTGPYGSIKPSSFVIPHLTLKEETTVQDAITQALRFDAMLEWGVWPGQFGPTFFLNERGKREGAKRWRARVRPAKLTQTGQQMDQVYNKVVISWRDPDGTTKRMGPPGSGYRLTDSRCEDADPLNPVNEAGENRTKHLGMEDLATAETAAETARLFLEKVKLLDGSGEATLSGFVEDSHGIEWPYDCVHGGDEIEFIDASIRSPRYIVEARRSRKARAVNIKLDAPPDSYEAILAELQVRETAIGFGS